MVLLVMGNVAADELAAERHRGAQHNETAAGTDGFALRRRLRALAPFGGGFLRDQPARADRHLPRAEAHVA